jgi:uncharacterized integral membrane protein (TIGR00698 family)
MDPPPAPAAGRRLAPGLATVALLAAAAFVGARLPGGALLGPLVLALLLGVAARAAWRRPTPWAQPGVAFAARTLLRLGIVLLGVRLDARALLDLGPWVLVGSALGALVAFGAIEVAGRAWRVPLELRRLVGIGTAICGASAIAAALPLVRPTSADPRDDAAAAQAATVAIGAISLLGTVGVLAFVAADAWLALPTALLAALAGATLQEVGQAVAAGTAVGGPDSELALLVKLSRVVWLAPALLALGALGRAAARGSAASDATGRAVGSARGGAGARPPLVPGFVVGFLTLGLLTSSGVLPAPLVAASAVAGTLCTAAAMAAIGLGVDGRALGRQGRQALALGAVGFAALAVAMGLWYTVVLR